MKKALFILLIPLIIILSNCNQSRFTYIKGKINIVATTTMLGDLVSEIGKENVNLYTLMKPGVDPHSYKPKPSDRYALREADLVVYNGLHLEAKLIDVISEFAKKTFSAEEALSYEDIIHDEHGNPDPHVWFDVTLWQKVSLHLSTLLQGIDPLNESAYQNNYHEFNQKLMNLDTYIKNRALELAEYKRILVTAHDAFSYFGRAYDFQVHAIQGISTQTEASVADIKALAMLVKDLNVRAIFIESSIPKATINSVKEASIALGHPIILGGELYSDSLIANESYITTLKTNIDTIVNSLREEI